ncbi:hypothetical protein CCACVL1_20859, partial [Corchorus capsularis]
MGKIEVMKAKWHALKLKMKRKEQKLEHYIK